MPFNIKKLINLKKSFNKRFQVRERDGFGPGDPHPLALCRPGLQIRGVSKSTLTPSYQESIPADTFFAVHDASKRFDFSILITNT